jgi:RecA/RadA recombinase
LSDILKTLLKSSGNEFGFDLSKNNAYEIKGFIDTGCYFLNAVLGDGDIFHGVPYGKRITFAGPPSTAKSFFTAHIIKQFLDADPTRYVVMFESEGATINEMADNLGIDKTRVIVLPVLTVEEFKFQSVAILKTIQETRDAAKKAKEPIPQFLMCLDSLGMLSTLKESNDADTQSTKADMTRTRQIKAIFRLITMKLSLTQTALLTISHTYDTQDLYPKKIVSGGSGILYASDVIIILTKSKQKDGTETIGAIIKTKIEKSRFSPEEKFVKILLMFNKGMQKYSWFVDFGVEHGILTKEGHSFVFPFELENGVTKVRSSTVIKKPEEYFSDPKLLALYREKALEHFSFSGSPDGTLTELDMVDDDDTVHDFEDGPDEKDVISNDNK